MIIKGLALLQVSSAGDVSPQVDLAGVSRARQRQCHAPILIGHAHTLVLEFSRVCTAMIACTRAQRMSFVCIPVLLTAYVFNVPFLFPRLHLRAVPVSGV